MLGSSGHQLGPVVGVLGKRSLSVNIARYLNPSTGRAASGIDDRIALTAAFGIGRQCILELIGQAKVVHYQIAGLVAKNAVYAGGWPASGRGPSVISSNSSSIFGMARDAVHARPHSPVPRTIRGRRLRDGFVEGHFSGNSNRWVF